MSPTFFHSRIINRCALPHMHLDSFLNCFLKWQIRKRDMPPPPSLWNLWDDNAADTNWWSELLIELRQQSQLVQSSKYIYLFQLDAFLRFVNCIQHAAGVDEYISNNKERLSITLNCSCFCCWIMEMSFLRFQANEQETDFSYAFFYFLLLLYSTYKYPLSYLASSSVL